MTYPTFTPPVAPSYSGATKTTKPRIKRTQFGDGYSQRSGDGINRSLPTLKLKWDPISSANAAAIEAFMSSHDDGSAFFYTVPRETVPRLWSLVDMERTYPYPNDDALTVTLQAEADL